MIGTAIGPYRVLERLGAGGMGEVFLAEDTRLGRRVALKRVADASLTAPDARARLLREARAAAGLNHPGIASIHDVIEDGPNVCIVMEYVQGEPLSALLRSGSMGTTRAVAIAAEVAESLAAAHAAGILHCDLKPANILVTPAGHVKVLDFGLAQRFAQAAPDTMAPTAPDLSLPSFAGAAGTPGYIAPERLTGGRLDGRSDVFSLGVVLYEMLTGRRPFQGNDFLSLAVAELTTPVPNPSTIDPTIPPALAQATLRALARDPGARFQSSKDFGDELRRLERLSWTDAPATLPDAPAAAARERAARPRRARRWTVAGLALAAVIAIVAAGWLTLARFTPRGAVPSATRPGAAVAVAVRGFANLSGDRANDYLGTGFSDDLTTRLAGLGAVTVVPRSTTMAYLAESPGSTTLARDLGVTYIVEGGVQRSGDRLRVGVNLLRADGSVGWARTFEGTMADLFKLQNQVAEGLAGHLDAALSEHDRQRLSANPTTNVEAFADYSQAQLFLERWDQPGNVDRAIEGFQRAMSRDRKFAPAQAGLGWAYWQRYSETKDAAWIARAVEATLDAQRLDPESAPVHVSLGIIYAGVGRTDAAIEELRRAIALQPNEAEAYRWLGDQLALKGQLDQAVREYRKGIDVRPNYFRTHNSMGLALLRAGRSAEASAAFRRVTELQPDSVAGFNNLGVALVQQGDTAGALASFTRAAEIAPYDYAALSNIGSLQYWSGRFAEAKATYERMLRVKPKDAAAYRNLGDALARLGDARGGKASYERALAMTAADLKVNPNDPDFLVLAAILEAKLGRKAAARQYADRALKQGVTGDTLMGSADVHALAGELQPALEQLRQALAGGYSRVLARYDDNLYALRVFPEYSALLGSEGVPPAPSPQR